MKKWTILPVFILSAVFSAFLRASDNARIAGVKGDLYFGHISLSEAKLDGDDPTVQRDGAGLREPAVLNLPIGPGDVIRTTSVRRCEIQFDTGTIIRLDVDSEITIETILAPSLSSSTSLSNFVLSKGRLYVMYKRYNGRETFQILTPNAAVKMNHGVVALVGFSKDGTTDVQVQSGRASVLFGTDAAHSRDRSVKSPGRFLVHSDGRFETAFHPVDAAFAKWNERINAEFLKLHQGISPLPKPLRRLPLAVFEFARKFGNANGEWLWDDLYGYVWRPFLNDRRYPWGNWQPYICGRWTVAGGMMFWVPEEPWGWVPYHLGLWQWDKMLGWIWLPGSLFAPAWVVWDLFDGFYAWRPWSLFDWYLQGGKGALFGAYGFSDQGDGWHYDWPAGSGDPGSSNPPMTKIRKDQLKKGEAQALPLPKEFGKTYRTLVAALERKDGRVLESLKEVPSRLAFVSPEDLRAERVHEKVLSWASVKSRDAAPDGTSRITVREPVRSPLREAIKTYVAGEEFATWLPRTAGAGVARPSGSDGNTEAGPIFRFRDWNPDILIARKLGVRIEYSSRTNEVRCPEMRISSRDHNPGWIARPPNMEGIGPSSSSGFTGGGGFSGSASSVRPDRPSAGSRESSGGRGGGDGD